MKREFLEERVHEKAKKQVPASHRTGVLNTKAEINLHASG